MRTKQEIEKEFSEVMKREAGRLFPGVEKMQGYILASIFEIVLDIRDLLAKK